MSNWDLWTYSVTVVPFCYHDSLIPWIVPTDIYSLFSHLLCDDCYHVLLLLIVFPLKGNPAFENLHLWFCWGPLLHLVNKEWWPKNHGPMFSRIQTLSYKWVINSLQWQSNRSTANGWNTRVTASSIQHISSMSLKQTLADCWLCQILNLVIPCFLSVQTSLCKASNSATCLPNFDPLSH